MRGSTICATEGDGPLLIFFSQIHVPFTLGCHGSIMASTDTIYIYLYGLCAPTYLSSRIGVMSRIPSSVPASLGVVEA